MKDIVERLRNHEATYDVYEDAADEIERLRGWLLNIQIDVSDIADTCNRLADVIEKVRGRGNDD